MTWVFTMFIKTLLVLSILFTVSCSSKKNTINDIDHLIFKGSYFNFIPLIESADSTNWHPSKPWKLANGFTQTIVSDETALNIYNNGRDDWHDMMTVNETGTAAGRYLYRTHEISDAVEGGAISVVDLQTGRTEILIQDASYTLLDGIRWTPWGSVLFAEETTGGRLFEVYLDPNNPMKPLKVIDRPSAGRMTHEGIEIDTKGNIYLVDEHRGRSVGCYNRIPCGGGIYKFVPNTYADLSSGSLYVLGFNIGNLHDNTGQATWLGPIDPSNVRESGTAVGGASYQRPEDLEIIGNTLYIAITEGPRDQYNEEIYEGRVIALNLETMIVSNFVKAGVNVAVEIGKPGDDDHQTGFDNVDNLAQSPDGHLIMIEDNSPSDIWFASTETSSSGASQQVSLFASLTDPGAEGSGIYFSPTDPKTLYVNIQHSARKNGDGTWAIRREKRND